MRCLVLLLLAGAAFGRRVQLASKHINGKSHVELTHSQAASGIASTQFSLTGLQKSLTHGTKTLPTPLKLLAASLLASSNLTSALQFSGRNHSTLLSKNHSQLVGRPLALDRRSALRARTRHKRIAMLHTDPFSDALMQDLAANLISFVKEPYAGLKIFAGGFVAGFARRELIPAKRFLLQGITGLPIQDITEEVFRPTGWQPIQTNPYPDAYPLTENDLKRTDDKDDSVFYSSPRFVYHIDEGAREALTNYYQTSITKSNLDVLDICSSWVSHYPRNFKQRMNTVVGTGLNALELEANQQLSSSVVCDLNVQPELPFANASFDVVTCVVSVDYLTSPLKVFTEVHRVLKPGGRFIISQSNRLFPTKAVSIWLRLGELNRLRLTGSYIHFAGGFSEPTAFDISARGARNDYDKEVTEWGQTPFDPMYIVEATKL